MTTIKIPEMNMEELHFPEGWYAQHPENAKLIEMFLKINELVREINVIEEYMKSKFKEV